MRLYTRTGATALDDPEFGHFDASPEGGFDFPDDLSDRLHRFHWRGQPMWETDVERQQRLMQEELDRRRDPASLFDAVAQLMNAAKASQAITTPSPEPEPTPVTKQPRKRTAAKPALPAE